MIEPGSVWSVAVPEWHEAIRIIRERLPNSRAMRDLNMEGAIWNIGQEYWNNFVAGNYASKYGGPHGDNNQPFFYVKRNYVMYADVMKLFMPSFKKLPKNFIGKQEGGSL